MPRRGPCTAATRQTARGAKLLVGGQPICSQQQIKRIDPVWVFGPVPNGFWDDSASRRNYLLWLGHKLRFRVMEDWYRITKKDITAHHGSRPLSFHHNSPAVMVMDLFPSYDWCEWLFVQSPSGFWHRPENRKRYLLWLGRKLRLRRPTDWYRVTLDDVRKNFGRSLWAIFPSFLDALEECFPELDWDRQRYMPLTEMQILAWADEYYRTHGKWPTAQSGPVLQTGEFWRNLDANLRDGDRGLPGGSSLARLLDKERNVRHHLHRPRLSQRQILRWADAYFREHGVWPKRSAGKIAGTDESWCKVDAALHYGSRGLPGGFSLPRLLEKRRGVRNVAHLPPLSEKQIIRWQRRFHRATGRWPTDASGPIAGAPGENWAAVDMALRDGFRGLPGGSSLSQLRKKHRLK